MHLHSKLVLVATLALSGCTTPNGTGSRPASPRAIENNRLQPVSTTLTEPVFGKDDQLQSLELSRAGKLLITGVKRFGKPNTGIIAVWDVATKKLLRSWPLDISVADLALSPEDELLVTATNGTEGARFRMWSLPAGKLLHTWPADMNPRVEFSPDGKVLATGDSSSLELRGEAEWQVLRKVPDDRPFFTTALAFSPDGNRLACGRNDVSQVVKVVDAHTGRQLWTGSAGECTDLDFSPDGKLLATISDSDLFVFNAVNGKVVTRVDLKDEGNGAVAFSPDGKTLACYVTTNEGKSHVVQLRETRTWAIKRTIRGGGPLAFLPDGKTLIGLTGKQVVFWPL